MRSWHIPVCPCGLSPRMRGNLRHVPSVLLGEWVYPRACGATQLAACVVTGEDGLSPRMRGNHRAVPRRPSACRVYPRACGATAAFWAPAGTQAGLSPRMRGNPDGDGRAALYRGSIPAHAGQPSGREGLDRRADGLSPRMRGNRGQHGRAHAPQRSIPAHAGQPGEVNLIRSLQRVYPRACGATWFPLWLTPELDGLSPRMRGNRSWRAPETHKPRSIPAHAGQPGVVRLDVFKGRVYPRACGATPGRRSCLPRCVGLSPRMRGNPLPSNVCGVRCGSIPAHAGQPLRLHRMLGMRWGLSPRMRGNH